MSRRLPVILSLYVLAASAADRAPVDVFVSLPPQAYLLKCVGGDRVRVTVMLAPGQAPETFDPTPHQVRELAGARLYFLAGVPFETAWKEVLKKANPELEVVPCCGQDNEYGPVAGPDPHYWTSPVNAMHMAQTMFDYLVQADSQGRADYQANLDRLLADLRELDAYIRHKFQHRRTDVFITAHAAWGWLAQTYGLKEMALEKNGREIGPRGLATLLQVARREDIHTVFVQKQFRTPVAESLARQLDAELVNLDPLAEDYIENMTRVADRIAEALQ
jgi:zinc transport system substrate-binding protein